MEKKRAKVNNEILVWARKTVNLSIPLAAKKIGVSSDKLEEWEKGESLPTIKQLYKVAATYSRPFALFYFPAPPKHFKPLKDFRKFPENLDFFEEEEYKLQKEILLFNRKREIALELTEALDQKPEKFTFKATIKEDAKSVANRLAKHLNINYKEIVSLSPGYDALNYWKKLLESHGILVFQTSGIPLPTMRGACIVKELFPTIIINSNDSENGRIFSLFHELAHIVIREDGITNFRYANKFLYDQVEIFCNQVAAELLVPSELLLNSDIVRNHNPSERKWTFGELRDLARLFCVSQEVILRRLLTLGQMNQSFYNQFKEGRVSIKRKKNKGGDYYRNVVAKNGKLYLNLVIESYYQNKLSASSLSDYINVKISNLRTLENTLYA